ncbi:DUF397 domain-containing protein [Nocardiopsis sp. HUAS JQ3]|uniref:DUF397 domain-containing protein n=1 Tax=Nocardiopsis sp. HUAS JQ3 TaxID=3061629 RepID=UPI0023A919F9|nr:DUF397 domain-containing protein [Nocardiopsis sp. HUAS JQ3]WDZ90282.1 DUF397 domain-containing protein [Nocardiopsis sp. HUAS JQ3]
MRWRKSSYSGGGGGNCVEISNWRKPSYSGGSGGECVEVSDWHKSSHSANAGECVEVAEGWTETRVRDTQNREHGHLSFTTPEWTNLLNTLKVHNR